MLVVTAQVLLLLRLAISWWLVQKFVRSWNSFWVIISQILR
jgi:hypothetical protein